MIHLSNISTVFSGHHVLFNQLNLTVDPGDNIALIGPSGCGKSTLLRYLLGVLSPDKGRVFVDGVALDQRDQCQLNQMRLSMGMLFQSAALFDSFTVEENIAFPLIENN
ncbi:MAG: ATP-binding cassette domain-containing protein, partial [Candidatus Marinamargulisbacteria bacterium]